MPDNELDVQRLVSAMLEHEVIFVVIGGMAAVVHGSPFITQDLDITPERSAPNLTRLSAALRSVDARVRTRGVEGGLAFSHDGESLGAVGFWNLTTRHGDLDISFVPSGTEGFDDLIRDSSQIEAFDLVIPVASLADIIRSKQAANRPKDQRVLPVLREILGARFDDRPSS